jgi:hypothetical protein
MWSEPSPLHRRKITPEQSQAIHGAQRQLRTGRVLIRPGMMAIGSDALNGAMKEIGTVSIE